MYWVYEMTAMSPSLWLLQLLLVAVCLLPDILIEVARTHGRGLSKFLDRTRAALGFPVSTTSTLPAYPRRPRASARRTSLAATAPPPYVRLSPAGSPAPAEKTVRIVDAGTNGSAPHGTGSGTAPVTVTDVST